MKKELMAWLAGAVVVALAACSDSSPKYVAMDASARDTSLHDVEHGGDTAADAPANEVASTNDGADLLGGTNDAAPDVSPYDAGVVLDTSTPDAGGTNDVAVADVATMPMLTIGSGFRFTTATLTVAPGTAIMVKNDDTVPHTVTSETAPDVFSPSGVFDTGIISAGGAATITIPASAAAGTVYYYYCNIHRSAMIPANGMITVQP